MMAVAVATGGIYEHYNKREAWSVVYMWSML
jgi:hypothetical protein